MNLWQGEYINGVIFNRWLLWQYFVTTVPGWPQKAKFVSSCDCFSRTALQCSAYVGYVNCMSVLIEHDADANAQDNEVKTSSSHASLPMLSSLKPALYRSHVRNVIFYLTVS